MSQVEVRIEGVGVQLGDHHALAEVDLRLIERRIGVIGLNGSGKSTLARLLNGLVLPTTGRVLVDGADTRAEARVIRRRVGFVFTDPDAQILMPTPAEDVAFSLRGKGLSKSEIRERAVGILAGFGLADRRDAPAHLLSGGEKQLLALAAVLATEPDLVVCDEPTTLLDLRNALRMHEVIAGLAQSVVLLTHHLDAVAGFDRVIVMHEGRVYADADPSAAIEAYRRLAAEVEHR